MTYLAHTENSLGVPHVLSDHLRAVGELAHDFAENCNSGLSEGAQWSGLLHDIGKYRDEFQQYLQAKRDSSTETHHAVYGAALAYQRGWLGPAFAIAGHHAGLHDLHELQMLVEGSTYRTTERVPQLTARFESELISISQKITEPHFVENELSADFYIRILFSMLVDADFLDTEMHYNGKARNTYKLQAASLLQLLIAEKESKLSNGKLKEIRNRIFEQCLDAAKKPPGFFSLTVPTGGGKTLAGMAFALAQAAQAQNQLRRIIVVIPYLSIIEQNAAQYRRILDPNNLGIVIEHHSSVNVPEDTGESRSRAPFEKHPNEYAAENWDAPVIVTTSVQFIESLFANRTSRCRKLHNIAHSVVIFDEVQTLPSHLLNPSLSVFRELRDHYGVSFVFSTATQPAFLHSPTSLSEGFKQDEIQEITQGSTAENFLSLQRVTIHPPKSDETTGWDTLAEQMAQHKQALCIVNIRRHAYDLWEKLRRVVPHDKKNAVFHLSSAMCAEHRLAILGDDHEPALDTVRYRLRHNLPCQLVSTQLIEAGVDVDFPIVWRALGPLDSIVQAAGRCNRENRLLDEAGNPTLGKVIIFRPEDNALPHGVYRTASDITVALLAQVEADTLATDHKLFGRYFNQLHQLVPTDQKTSIQSKRKALHFRQVAALAKVIDNDSQAVIVPYGKGCDIVEQIRTRSVIQGQPRFSRDDLRKLQRYMVNLHSRDFEKLVMYKAILPLLPNLEIHVLTEGWYHFDLGIVIDKRPTEDFFQ